jgi:hypothetical protein
MFKKAIFSLVLAVTGLVVVADARADQFVRGHVRYNGSYVQPHFRSNPDHNFYNNYSTFPNVNPYTGHIGTHHYPTYTPYHYTPYRPVRSFGF